MADVLASDELIDEPSDYGAIRPGTRLGRYELLVPIARGGMARVWAARLHGQRGFQKVVAIKTILPHFAQEAEFERMFLDEARIASGVHHPNVCEIYELGEEKRTLYLVMEWVNGDSLARVLRASGKTESFEPRVVARVVADACAGLHAAHELTDDDGRQLSVVHRDLSPHNILLTADGTAKVADFGVAKALGQLHEATSKGQLKGKIAYMAPEQVTAGLVDRRSDVFSMGCVLYEATTGQRPFPGDGDHQVMHAVLKGEFPAPTSLLRSYPQELERIVMRALSPQPILRYPTAERMRFALEEYLARGHLITQANVAQVVRSRIGEQIERRKERIRQASSAGDGETGGSEPPGGMTPSNDAQDGGHRSGVKALTAHPAHPAMPFHGTMPPAGYHEAHPMAGGAAPPFPGGPSYPSLPAQTPPPSIAKPFMQTAPMPGTAAPHAMHPMHPMQSQPMSMPGPYPGAIPATMPASGAPSYGAPPPFAERPSDPPAGAAQYALAIGVGVLLAVLIGAGGFVALEHRRGSPAVDPSNGPGAATSGATSAPATTPVPMEIAFRVTPTDAVLSVDGLELATDARRIPRPAMGKSVTVVARAKSYDDATVLVDFFSNSPLEITLKPSTAPQAAAAPATPPVATVGQVVASPEGEGVKEPPKDAPKDPPKDPPKRRTAPKNDPALPPNPF